MAAISDKRRGSRDKPHLFYSIKSKQWEILAPTSRFVTVDFASKCHCALMTAAVLNYRKKKQ